MPTGKPTKLKPCKICGELFLPEKPSSRICKKDHHIPCPICGKDMIWNSTSAPKPCSKKCRKELTRRKNLEKYGVEHPMQSAEVRKQHEEAMIKKYGVASPLQSEEIKQKAIQSNRQKFGTDWALSNKAVKAKAEKTMVEKYGGKATLQSKELTEKYKATMVEKYGVDNPTQSEEIKKKREQTYLDRYGVTNPMSNKDIAQKMANTRKQHSDEIFEHVKQTWLQKYGVDNVSKLPEIKAKIQATLKEKYGSDIAMNSPIIRSKIVATNLQKYGVPYFCMTEKCLNAQGDIISSVNRKFGKALEAQNIPYKFEFRLDNKSYDIYIPGTDILIELDPTYTHNIIGNHWNDEGLPADYHLEKSKTAKEHGYRCIHIFDWDDWDKIIDMLKPRKPIYARKCTIYKLKKNVGDKFLSDYHLQGTCRGQLVYFGLVLDGELYQVMTFGRSRYDKNYSIELLRLCTKPGYTVIGGASRLFNYVTTMFELDDIISYCDLSKFNGEVYEKIGMKHVRNSPPQAVWSKEDKKITANLLRQRGFDQLFNTDYGKGTSNDILMFEHGWLPVYDCGQGVYEWRIK